MIIPLYENRRNGVSVEVLAHSEIVRQHGLAWLGIKLRWQTLETLYYANVTNRMLHTHAVERGRREMQKRIEPIVRAGTLLKRKLTFS